jgi:hypothetical protein
VPPPNLSATATGTGQNQSLPQQYAGPATPAMSRRHKSAPAVVPRHRDEAREEPAREAPKRP